MTAREVLDGIKDRLTIPSESFNFIQQAAHENQLLKVDLPRLTRAVEAVLELHHVGDMHGTPYCKECSKSHWIVPAPCPTVAAIENALGEAS